MKRATLVTIIAVGMGAAFVGVSFAVAHDPAVTPDRQASLASRRDEAEGSRTILTTRVIDGDTLVMDGETIRLSNIDAPELAPKSKCWAEARLAIEAKEALAGYVAEARRYPVRLVRDKGRAVDQYGRTLGHLTTGNGKATFDVGAAMVADGIAVPWTGHRWSWCEPITSAKAGVGLLNDAAARRVARYKALGVDMPREVVE